MLPSVPVGTQLFNMCGKSCKTECDAAPKAAEKPAELPCPALTGAQLTDESAKKQYFICLATKCVDMDSGFLKVIAGTAPPPTDSRQLLRLSNHKAKLVILMYQVYGPTSLPMPAHSAESVVSSANPSVHWRLQHAQRPPVQFLISFLT
jgi:hypothetical protein